MILIVESAPGGMTTWTIKEKNVEEIEERLQERRYWMNEDTFRLRKFSETADPGDYMHFSKGMFIKVTEEYKMENKEIIPAIDKE